MKVKVVLYNLMNSEVRIVSVEEFKNLVIEELRFISECVENEETRKEYINVIEELEEYNTYEAIIETIANYGVLGLDPFVDIHKHIEELASENRTTDIELLLRGSLCYYLNIPYTLVCRVNENE